MATQPNNVSIKIVGVSAGKDANPFNRQIDPTGFEGKELDDLMEALKAFVAAHPRVKWAEAEVIV